MTLKTKQQLIANSQDLTKAIINYKGFGLTHTLAIAEQFGKEHKNVLRDTREFVKKVLVEKDSSKVTPSSETASSKVTPAPESVDIIEFCKNWSYMDNSYMVKELHYLDEQGKERPFYMLSKKVAIGLIIAYTGQKAFKVRLQILDRFDELEKEQVDKKKVFAGSKGGYKGQFERVKAENEDLKLKVEELEKQNQEYLDSALDSETKLNIALKGMLKIAEAIAEIQNK